MTEYNARSTNTLSFEIKKGEEMIGKLTNKSWFKFDAVMEFENGKHYEVTPKGFWGTTIELKDNELILLKFKMNWRGEIVVQTFFGNLEKDYVFKHNGIFKKSFMLVDTEGVELLYINVNMKWNKANYEYDITSSDAFEALSNKDILLLNSVHCANYYMSMMMGV